MRNLCAFEERGDVIVPDVTLLSYESSTRFECE
jgi:hypothetical protein